MRPQGKADVRSERPGGRPQAGSARPTNRGSSAITRRLKIARGNNIASIKDGGYYKLSKMVSSVRGYGVTFNFPLIETCFLKKINANECAVPKAGLGMSGILFDYLMISVNMSSNI